MGLSCSTRILGCILDCNMTFKEHIVDIAKSCVFKLRNMYNVGRCITIDAANVMVHTMIISKRHPLWPTFNKSSYLQSVQNTAARFITQTRKYDHIKPVLKDLHWLPIRSRIECKILSMVHKSLYGCNLYTSENCSTRDLTVAQEQMERTTFSPQRSKELRLEQGHLDTLARHSGKHFQTH